MNAARTVSERAGILDLRDLASRHTWGQFHLESFLAAEGLVPEGDITRRLTPPRVLVVISDWSLGHAAIARSQRWFAEAEHLIVVRIEPDMVAARDADPEVVELSDDEWKDVTASLRLELIDDPSAALARAKALVAALSPREPERVLVPVPEELPVSPWNPYVPESFERCFLTRIQRQGHEIVIGPEADDDAGSRASNPGFRSLGSDPVHPAVGWRGDRMHVYWTWKKRFFAASDHDYPCGPGKKLYGYDDNDPVQVTLAPDLSHYAARFDHDVLLTRAVPLPWQRAGDFDVLVRPEDPYRAVFFAQDPANDDSEHCRSGSITDESNRDCAPALVLMPGGYAIDLSFRVLRIMKPNGEAEQTLVGGPGEGFAVFDAEHQLVRRARGKLVGGWYRFATVEDDGWYWREDLTSGERSRVARMDFTISEDPSIEAVARDAMLEGKWELAKELRSRGAVRTFGTNASDYRDVIIVYALPQTKNVLLVAKEHVRVI